MEIRDATEAEIRRALAITQGTFDYNLKFRRLDRVRSTRQGGDVHKVLLGVVETHKHRKGELVKYAAGCRIGVRDASNVRTITSACWHVHGVFFDVLLSVAPEALIISGGSLANSHVTSNLIYLHELGLRVVGNWRDWDQGSEWYPRKMSTLCYCTSQELRIPRGLNEAVVANGFESTKPYDETDIGCYVDGWWGQYAGARVVEFAISHGFADKELEDIAERHLASMGPSESEPISFDEHEFLVDSLDDVEKWLNDVWCSEGMAFGWMDGEFHLAPICDDGGCDNESCWCHC